MPAPRFSGSSTLQLSYFRHKTVPQMPGAGNSQDEIDQLFDSLE